MTNLKRGFANGFASFGKIPTTLINFLILSFIYIVGVGITSIISKILRKNFFALKIDKKSNSYFEDIKVGKSPDGMFKQY